MATSAASDELNPMETIFHEKQEGSLCAQHCLNALLQGHYFTAVDLAEIGRDLDLMERQQMAVAGVNSEEYKTFIQQPSSNYDDSGFFSIQVIQKALDVWSMELLPYTSSCLQSQAARRDPRSQGAYICNFREHWFTIRKLGTQWFNLNSLLTYPELVSDTFLTLLLTQLQQEGYSIFVAKGDLPDCDAEQILRLIPAVQKIKPRLLTEKQKSPTGAGTSEQFGDDDLQKALAESKRMVEENDESLKRALALSIESMPVDFSFNIPQMVEHRAAGPTTTPSSSTPSVDQPTAEEIRQKRLAFLDKDAEKAKEEGSQSTSQNDVDSDDTSSLSEEEVLKLAMAMSMEGSTS